MPKKKYYGKVNPITGLPLLDEENNLLVRPKHGLVYWLVAKPAFWLSRIIYMPRASGRENIPKKGGFVIASTHISNLDSVTISSTARRRLFFMAKIELSRGPVGAVLNRAGIIPVDRARRNSEALSTAVQVLKQGGVVAIYPEGKTNRGSELAPFKFGAVAMASRAHVPIVPAAIVGKYSPFRRKISIVYGKPTRVDGANLKAANEKLWYTINGMREEIRRGR
jgi:1-acyl-sn-glycerol-3-phosphate acyltransferase